MYYENDLLDGIATFIKYTVRYYRQLNKDVTQSIRDNIDKNFQTIVVIFISMLVLSILLQVVL
jgi:hypothetical protein